MNGSVECVEYSKSRPKVVHADTVAQMGDAVKVVVAHCGDTLEGLIAESYSSYSPVIGLTFADDVTICLESVYEPSDGPWGDGESSCEFAHGGATQACNGHE